MKPYDKPVVAVMLLSDEDILTSSDNFASDIFFDRKE